MMKRTLVALAAVSIALPVGIAATQANPLQRNWHSNSESIVSQRSFSPRRAFAQGQGRHHRGNHHQRLMEQLDLSSEQSAKIQEIHAQARAEMEGLHEQVKSAHEQMRSLLASDASPQQLRQQHQRLQNLRQQAANRRFETMLAVRQELTPQQRTQMAELMQQRHQGRGHGRHNFEGVN